MNVKALVAVVLLSASSLLITRQALADRPNLSPEQLAKARESASQLNPPVDFDAMLDEVDKLGVECTGDLTRKARIIICGQRIENAKLKADTQATRARIQATEARTEKLRKENAELIKEIQRRIKEDK
ncbi:MAG: hypothetical protein LBD06_09445 [Candidatus Accumulibacter sp.]|jgi:hypothetical protein|nr:hypothetical protein [Accumulibacter sp.]